MLNILLLIFLTISAISLGASPNYYPDYRAQQNYGEKKFVPIVSETNEITPDGTFSYSYATGDGQQVQAQGYLKNAGNKNTEAEVIQGSYSYTAPDGTPITVTYIADEFGFRAEGAHLPTPPPIPEAIQRSLELIAKAQGRSSTEDSGYSNQRGFSQGYKSQYPKPFRY